MAQIEPFIASDTPADISDGLAEGDYLAQVRGEVDASAVVILYATAAAAPADSAGYFQANPGDAFRFSAGPGCPPTWVRIDPFTAATIPGIRVPVALAQIEA